MNSKLANVATIRGGWFSRADAHACGYTDSEIRARVDRGQWVRLCRGAYVEPDPEEAALPPWEQALRHHIRMSKAIYRRLGRRVAVSHQSAVALHGLPTWGLDLRRVHVTRLSGHGRIDRDAVHHSTELEPSDIVDMSGVRLTSVARSVVDAACLTSYQAAVAVMDAALNRRMVTPDQLADAAAAAPGRHGSNTAINAVAFADGTAESVGESRLRVLMADHGLPRPTPQAEIRSADGELVGRVDFLFEERRLVVEFDGAMKYHGDDGPDVVVAEKWREDRIRSLGYAVVRVSWADLSRPQLIQHLRARVLAPDQGSNPGQKPKT